MPACPACKTDNVAGATFCQSCGIPLAAAVKHGGSEALCITLGLLFGCIGLWFLVVSPSIGTVELLGGDVVNLHRLALGETSSIVGAIFLAAAMRPRG